MRTKLMITSLCVTILFFTLFPYLHPTEAMGKISEGSGVAGIELEGLSRDEAHELLHNAVIEWQAGDPLIAESEHEILEIPRDLFVFDIDGTLNALEGQTKRTWTNFFRKTKDVMLPLEVTINQSRQSELNWPAFMAVEQTLNKGASIASQLKDGQVILEYEADAIFEEIELAEVRYPIEEASLPVIERLAEELDETVLQSENVFSFLESALLPNGIEHVATELSIVASAIYELALQTNLEVIERHQMATIPRFTEPGLEAAIDYGQEKNLLIYNPTASSYKLSAELNNQELSMQITTQAETDNVQFERVNIKEVEPRIIYRYDRDLAANQEIVEVEGTPGLQLEVYQKVTTQTEPKRVRISRDYYPPVNRVILTSTVQEEENPEEELVSDEAEGSDFFTNEMLNGSIGDRVGLALECNGDLECEEELGITAMDRMIASCFVRDVIDENEDVAGTASSNSFCDLIFFMSFLGLLSEETTSDTENTTDTTDTSAWTADDWSKWLEAEMENEVTPEEVPEEVVE